MTITFKSRPSYLRLAAVNGSPVIADARTEPTPEDLAWERRWQAEWQRRNVED
jgi:hypothetical protein